MKVWQAEGWDTWRRSQVIVTAQIALEEPLISLIINMNLTNEGSSMSPVKKGVP